MGPLKGVRIVEVAGIGPGPFAAMLLADMGADVIRVERPGGSEFASEQTELDFLNRGKRCLCVDLKTQEGLEIVRQLIDNADGVIEGFRPGVMEKLGLSPEQCMQRNERLVFGRVTGWGQTGPLAKTAGHDINYISLSGALFPIGRKGEKPTVPLNLVGDFGGGGMLLAFGLVCAILEAKTSGKGQVVDAAMVDGSALLMNTVFAAAQTGFWSMERGTNILDSGAPFYEVYETADGQYMSVGALEEPFYQALLRGLGLAGEELPNQFDMEQWPVLKARFAAAFLTRTRAEWEEVFAYTDACVTPVLPMHEAKEHPHNRARSSFVERDGVWQPRTAPRFSRTDGGEPRPPVPLGNDSETILRELGYADDAIGRLFADQVVRGSEGAAD